MTATTVACVWKTGGIYTASHVDRLKAQVERHAPTGTPFMCLSDFATYSTTSAMKHGWPGWWSKVELLNHEGPILYLDLDVNVIGDLGPLLEAAWRHDLVMARGFWGPDDPNEFNSSVMAWRFDAPSQLYDLFLTDPDRFMEEGKRRDRWGDQGFIAAHHKGQILAWQDKLPGMVCSYKRGALMGENLDDCRVLVSHGDPKPWATGGADEWLRARP